MSRLLSITTTVSLTTETCCNCHILFAMPAEMQAERRSFGGNFYCPNGHPQSYTKSRLNELQEQVEEAEKRMRIAKCEAANAQNAAAIAQAKVASIEKQQLRTNRRIHAGVCPCCNRTFQNLARHMETKHKGETKAKQA